MENDVHFLACCPAMKYVRQRHKVARELVALVEGGGDAYDIVKGLLSTDIKSFAAWVEDTWIERKKLLYA